MVIAAFPIAKLSVLLIKQISKPIANACKERAKNHPFFRTYVCMPPAQFYNWCEVRAKMWILNLGRPVNIPVLSEQMAIDLGANLLGETLIFVIGSALVIVEMNRQGKKEAAKEQARIEELTYINNTITDLYFTVQQQQTQLKEMERIIHSVSGKALTTPAPEINPPTPPPILQKSESHPPTGGAPPTPPTAVTPTGNASQMEKSYIQTVPTITPYPNKGIILKSLNYIQMDALSSVFPQEKSEKEYIQLEDKHKIIHNKRENAVLSDALYNIENNFKSLF